ncbi:MAG: hypothetical protein KI790_02245 [Cyclobacteriaceae bacterium]|nr:hypothetical protein [Cyclobacteriaceae bacterium HetDA_MAG_MS6]
MRIYFLLNPTTEDSPPVYLHNLIAIAEGLKDLGHPFYANQNYWKDSPSDPAYLFNQDPQVDPRDCDIIITSSRVSQAGWPKGWFENFRDRQRPKVVFIDTADGMVTPGFSKPYKWSDIILKCHYNEKYNYPDNFHPWQFGLTKRIINAVSPAGYDLRELKLLSNFRVAHQVRNHAKRHFLPLLKDFLDIDESVNNFSEYGQDPYERHLWSATGQRHYQSYYDRLSNTLACACFGGFMKKPLYKGVFPLQRVISKLDRSFPLVFFQKFDRIVQFDSWRFWEAMVAGCCAFHVDFDHYGVRLPVNPVNYEHYIGVNFENLKNTQNFLLTQENAKLHEIGSQGRDWVLDHYSPKAVAKRLLELAA